MFLDQGNVKQKGWRCWTSTWQQLQKPETGWFKYRALKSQPEPLASLHLYFHTTLLSSHLHHLCCRSLLSEASRAEPGFTHSSGEMCCVIYCNIGIYIVSNWKHLIAYNVNQSQGETRHRVVVLEKHYSLKVFAWFTACCSFMHHNRGQ